MDLSHQLIFFKYLSVFLLCLFIFYLIGHFLLKLVKFNTVRQGFFGNLFFSLLTGLSAFSILTSLVATGGRTVQILFIGLAVVGYVFNSKSPGKSIDSPNTESSEKKINWSYHWIFISLAVFIYYILQFYLNVSAINYPYYQPSADLSFYTTVSDYMLLSGIENTKHVYNMLDSSFHYLMPYHYYELWINAGITRLFSINNFLSFALVVSPIFYCIIFFGLLAILENMQIHFTWLLLLVLLFPLMDRLKLDIFNQFPLLKYADSFDSQLVSISNNAVPKAGPFYFFLIASLIYTIQKNYNNAALFLLALPIATITAGPAIFSGLIVALVLLCLAKKITFAQAKKYSFLIFVVGLSIAVFYYVNGSLSTGAVKNNSLSEGIINTESFRSKLNLFIGNLIIVVCIYIPFILLFIYGRKRFSELSKALDLPFFIASIIIVLGFAIWAVLSHIPNAYQFGNRISVYSINLLLFVSTIFVIVKLRSSIVNKYIQVGLAFLLFVFFLNNAILFYKSFSIVPRLSKGYVSFIDSQLKKSGNKIGVCFIATDDFPKNSVTKNSDFLVSGYYLSLLGNGYRTVSVSDYAIPGEPSSDNHDSLSKYAKEGIFYHYVEDQKKSRQFISLEQSQFEFIKRYNIQYLILSPNSDIPRSLQPYVQARIRDGISKDQFIVLDDIR